MKKIIIKDISKSKKTAAFNFNGPVEIVSDPYQEKIDYVFTDSKNNEIPPAHTFNDDQCKILYSHESIDASLLGKNRSYQSIPLSSFENYTFNHLHENKGKRVGPSNFCEKINHEFEWELSSSSEIKEIEDNFLKKAQPEGNFVNYKQIGHLILDELLTNAIYKSEKGVAINKIKRVPHTLADNKSVNLQFWIGEKDSGFIVTDPFGKLTPDTIFKYLSRGGPTLEIEKKEFGSGLGIIFLYQHCSLLAFNIRPGHFTQVIVKFIKEKRDKLYYNIPKTFYLFFEEEKL